MKSYMIAAFVLVLAGILGLVYGQFSYTSESQGAKLGPIEVSIQEKQTVNIPVWAGAGAIIVGAGILAMPLFRR